MGDFTMHPLARFLSRMLVLVRDALDQRVITPGDAAETLGTGLKEIHQLLARPPIARDEQRVQKDLEAAAFAHKAGPSESS